MLDKVNTSSICAEQELIWEHIIPAPNEPNLMLPLYGLDLLSARPTDPILIVEGGKTAAAAQILFLI